MTGAIDIESASYRLGVVSSRHGARALRIGVLVASLAPLFVLAFVLAVRIGPDFASAGDNAETELRIRDIGSHPVLLGLYSREGWSHPGPALYYVLAIGYRLSGSASIGMYLSALFINTGSIATILFVSRRFGGTALFLLNALAMAILVNLLGPEFVSDPWNPFISVLPYGALIACCWATACGARRLTPVIVFLASFCIQSHIGYVPLTLPVLGWAATVIAYRALHGKNRLRRSELITAVALGAVMWLPPVIQQLTEPRGNASTVWSYFRDPRHAIHSVADGYSLIADSFGWNPGRLNPHQWNFLSIVPETSGEVVPVVLIAFVLVSLLVLRRGPTQARALIGVLAASIAAGILSIWRTIDPIINYRLGWLPMIALLTASGSVWFVWLLLRPALGQARFGWVRASAAGVVMAGILAMTTLNAADARSVHLFRFSANGSDVVPTLLSQARRDLPAARGQIIVTARDPGARWFIPATVLWLEERGYDARVSDDRTPLLFGYSELTFGSHRVCDATPVVGQLMLGVRPAFNPGPVPVPNYRVVAQTSYLSDIYRGRPVMALYLHDEPLRDEQIRCRA